MGMFDQLSPQQRKLLGYGAVGVVGVVVASKVTGSREPEAVAPTVTPIQPMPSTDAIGVGELGDYFSAFTDTLGTVLERVTALEDADDVDPTPIPDPSDSGPTIPPPWYSSPPSWWTTAPPGAPAGGGSPVPSDLGDFLNSRPARPQGWGLSDAELAASREADNAAGNPITGTAVTPTVNPRTARTRPATQATSGLSPANYGGFVPVGDDAVARAEAYAATKPANDLGALFGLAVARYGGVYYGNDPTAQDIANRFAQAVSGQPITGTPTR